MSDTDDILLQILELTKENKERIDEIGENLLKVTEWQVQSNKDTRDLDTNLRVVNARLETIEDCEQQNGVTLRHIADRVNETVSNVRDLERKLHDHERRLHGPQQANGASNS